MGENTSILIIDDSRAICLLLKASLENMGIQQVDYCHSATAALEQIENEDNHYHALFIDLHMEGIDGLELINRLNMLMYRGNVVIMSGLEQKIIDFTLEVISNYNLKVLGSLEKPIQDSSLAFMVKRIRASQSREHEYQQYIKRRELEVALENDQVSPYFQPIISSSSNQITGLESLARIIAPEHGTLPPHRFIPVAEKFSLMDDLSRQLFPKAFSAHEDFCRQTGINCSLSFNVSPSQLYNEHLLSLIEELRQKYGLDKTSIKLEVTEEVALKDFLQFKNINHLRIQGYQLSLDDYGEGYTNLHQLKNIPFNEIKLDRKLVDGISQDKVLQAIVKSVKELADTNNLNLIAEGVENNEDLIEVEKIGIDLFQGFLFCRPKPIESLLQWYHSWEKVLTK